MSLSGQHLPSSAAESLSPTHVDRASSTRRDQEPSASDIELVPLVPAIDSSSQLQEGADGLSDKTPHQHSLPDGFRPASRQPHLYNINSSAVARLLLDSWVYEAVAMGLSIACLAAIAAIVAYYDEKAVPKGVITLNTAVSVLSTAARSGLIFVVSAVVGQLKWCWIRKSERQLQHLQTMDSASRGPVGAMQMVALWTGGTLAAAGGILTVLLVAFSPFLQQLLEYPLRDAHTPSSDAWVPQNLGYNSSLLLYATQGGTQLLEFPSARKGDTLHPLDNDAACPVSRCSWHGVKSVGWCSKCEDVTANAALDNNCSVDAVAQYDEFERAFCKLSLGAGLPLSVFSGSDNHLPDPEYKRVSYERDQAWPVSFGGKGYLNQTYDPEYTSLSQENQRLFYGNDTYFLGERNPLLVYGHALFGTNESPLVRGQNILRVEKAEMCILTLCEREYSVEKKGCATSWTETSRKYGNLFKTQQLCHESGANESNFSDLACWRPGDNDSILEMISLVEGECNFADLSERAFCPVQGYASWLQGNLPRTRISGTPRYGPTIEIPEHNTTDDVYHFSESYGKDIAPWNLTTDVELIEKALTKFGLDQTPNKFTGFTIIPEAYVHVRWQWMIFPVALELATLTLFILVIIHSRREGVPIWKSSILAIIYHSVEELRNERSPPTERLSDMQSAAEATAVGLWKSDDGLHRMARRTR